MLQALLLLALALSAGIVEGDEQCERLKATLTYTQEEAPRDLSGLLPVVVEKVNRVLDGVVDVEVEWNGADLQGRVGEHIVQCRVTRLASVVMAGEEDATQTSRTEDGREVTTQCFHVPFTILDTNECLLPSHHPMRHQCQEPSLCVNTIGSYECVCPRLGSSSRSSTISGTADAEFWTTLASEDRTPWEVSFQSTSRTSCPGGSSTRECCSDRAHTPDGMSCRRRFSCPVDPCANSHTNDCANEANCVLKDSPLAIPNYQCACPEDLMGNGHSCTSLDPKPEPKVMFDGKTATELTVKNNYYCGCTKPVIDACSGFPPCKGKHEICVLTPSNTPTCGCKPNYVMHEKYGCVDISPPLLRLRHDPDHDQTLRLKQGEEYREYMVDIVDENAEDYLRSLKITYSKPLPPSCLTQVGEFHVNYTVATPWTTPSFVRVTRRVIIDDINECTLNVDKYKSSCPSLIPQCDVGAGATCVNTFGSYACQCPQYSSGDGFLKSASFVDGVPNPEGYHGGSSCTDTSKPIITLKGSNPKIFKTCQCGGLAGVLTGKATGEEDRKMQADQRKLYEDDIKEMIRASSGAELCAAYDGKKHPIPTDCVKAVDHTHKGDIDLSTKVVVGEPVQKSPLHWVVPYDVADAAGNKATTVWRDVIVEEVDLVGVETKIRQDVVREQQISTKTAVEKAVREEKMKWERTLANEKREAVTTSRRSAGGTSRSKCPPCPDCDCGKKVEVGKDSCKAFCPRTSTSSAETCAWPDEGLSYAIVWWLEATVSPILAPIILLLALGGLAFFVASWMYYLLFSPRAFKTYYYQDGGNNAADNDILFNSNQQQQREQQQQQAPSTPYGARRTPQQEQNRHQQNGQGMNGMGSPPPSIFSPESTMGSPRFNSNANGFPRRDDRNGLYSPTPPIISPSKRGDGVRRTPY